MSSNDSLQDKLLFPSIPVEFLTDALLAARFRGMDVEGFLQANGVSPYHLREPGFRIPINKYSQILRQLRNQTSDAFFGFLSCPIPVKAFNVFCYSVVGCRNLKEVIQQANDFYSLFNDDFDWDLKEKGDSILLVVNVNPALPVDYRFIIQSLLLMAIRLFGWLLGEDVKVKSVNFTFTKHSRDESLGYLFGNRINYDCESNFICIDRHYGTANLFCTRDQIDLMLINTRLLFLFTPRKNPLSQEVRRLLLTKKHEEWLDVDAVASMLTMNPNQLWRKLKTEDTSFLEIRDQIKRDWSILLLEEPNYTIEVVANYLHYTDVSAFRKAFKKWTGLQPLQYREKLR